MTKREVIALAFMLAGIYICAVYGAQFLVGLNQLLFLLSQVGISGAPWTIPLLCLPSFLLATVGGLVAFRAGSIAGRVVPPHTLDEAAFPCKVHDVQAIAISMVGLILCAKALPHLASSGLAFFTVLQGNSEEMRALSVNAVRYQFVTQLLSFILGLILFAKANALAALSRRWQPTGATNTAE